MIWLIEGGEITDDDGDFPSSLSHVDCFSPLASLLAAAAVAVALSPSVAAVVVVAIVVTMHLQHSKHLH